MFDRLRAQTAVSERERFERLGQLRASTRRRHFQGWFMHTFGESLDAAWPEVDREYVWQMYGAAFAEHEATCAGGPVCPYLNR